MAKWNAGPGIPINSTGIPTEVATELTKPAIMDVPMGITVVELITKYREHAAAYYVKGGKQTSEVHCIGSASKFLRRLFGRLPAAEFSPLKLKAVREAMVVANLSRGTINKNINRIRRMFKWAAGEELLPGSILADLRAVEGLKSGRSEARESEPILPVDAAVVDATIPFLSPVVADMIRVQELTGMRPGEVCQLRTADIDRTGDVWRFTPTSHKTQHRGKRRVVAIGPKAQEILKRYLLRAEYEYCFSPTDSEKQRRRAARDARVTPEKYGNRPGTNRKRNPKWKPGSRYTTGSYRRAISRAVVLANKNRSKGDSPLPDWAPNRLRHNRATLLRRQFSIEAAQVVLGHSDPRVTDIYAERDLLKAEEIMRQIG